jgi:ribosomal protein L16 Arg81 hydroxylase
MTANHSLAQREAAEKGRPPHGLDEILAPVSADTFFAEYWEKQPLLVHRDDPEYYSSILTLADVDGILANSSLGESELRLVADGKEARISEVIQDTVEGKFNRLESLYAQYRSGATVNLVFLHERWPALAAVCQRLATELTSGIHGNVYLTPAQNRGLTPHHDPHDVFVLQLYGSKRWTLHPTQTPLPLHEQGYLLPPEGAGDPVMDFVLQPGDMVYLPRGTVHAATANESASLHLTIGISPMTWAHVLRTAVEQVVAKDVRYRTALPVGFVTREEPRRAAVGQLTELFDAFAGKVAVGEAIDLAASVMSRRRAPVLAGHLLDLESTDTVELDTKVQVRTDLVWRLSKSEEQVHLEFHGKTMDLPEFVEDELTFMIKADEFTGTDIPGVLDDAGRLVLIRQLLREGFLTRS